MIKTENVEGKKFVVLGLGKSGLATAASLQLGRANFIVWDDNEAARQKAVDAGYTVCDPMTVDLKGYEALVLSPGIPLTHPTPHPVVTKCRTAGVPIIGDIDLLFRSCPNATYIGVTGTNGKSTTTALIAHILEKAGRKVQVGGNLGTPALALAPLDVDGFYVLELSSYQLDLMQDNKLKIAVLLNITPDHFDRHGGMGGYIAAKKRIIRKMGEQTLVIGSDDPETRTVLEEARQQSSLQVEEISVLHEVNRGAVANNGQLYVYDNKGAVPIIHLSSLSRLPGTHNAQNVCAAFCACRAARLSNAQIVAGLQSFPGLAHRQQVVSEIKGVRFINDSKATNADAAGKALACYNNIYWILGGKPKVGGLNGLEPFMPRIRQAFLIGEASEEFATFLKGKVPFIRCGTLDVAIQKAADLAWEEKKPHAVVLLSPACASFDQFANFEERGNKFASFVKALVPELWRPAV